MSSSKPVRDHAAFGKPNAENVIDSENSERALRERPVSTFSQRALGLVAGIAALGLSGCIEPMYGPLSSNPDLANQLASIEVAPIPERMGHYVRDELIFDLNGTGATFTPRYRLDVRLGEQVRTPIVDTVTGRATSASIVIKADYKLVSIPEGALVTEGSALALASYDRFSNRLANVRAARDGEIRDARVIADSIRTRLAVALGGPQIAAPVAVATPVPPPPVR
jgi:LPS-assembly lipoprotein